MAVKYTNLTVTQLKQHYLNGDFTPRELVAALLQQAEEKKSHNTWITLLGMEDLERYFVHLEKAEIEAMPLYGVPFAIKDNIDLAGIATTAACAEFSYVPGESAFVVQQLIDAGAIPLGKTNLDQFATGLVGTRSPYGPGRNSFDPEYISGGSSAGSAIAVAQGLVTFSLGTDTAGSGRVPAAFNNILGLKPTKGLLSTRGVVPACRSLDVVSIFATTTDDINAVFDVAAKYDPQDPYARKNTMSNTETHYPAVERTSFRFAVPVEEQLKFFGDESARQLFNETVIRLEAMGGEKSVITFSPFIEAANLLYDGPWLTERYWATKDFLAEQPDAMLDVTRSIITGAKDYTALDTFDAFYRLQAYRQVTDAVLSEVDFLLTPTAGTIYTIEQLENDPVQLNTNLGYYTNYMNLLDYSAIAIPAGFLANGLPFGISLVSRAFDDKNLLNFACVLQQKFALNLGATHWSLPLNSAVSLESNDWIDIAVCGAHLSGLPLNHQLVERGSYMKKVTTTSQHYSLYALPGGPPYRPGLVRNEQGGTAIEVEVWSLPTSQLGSFLAGIPHPLGLGQVELADGNWVCGFICEAYVQSAAEDISQLGGWRAYMASR